jgi:hypothetical protein
LWHILCINPQNLPHSATHSIAPLPTCQQYVYVMLILNVLNYNCKCTHIDVRHAPTLMICCWCLGWMQEHCYDTGCQVLPQFILMSNRTGLYFTTIFINKTCHYIVRNCSFIRIIFCFFFLDILVDIFPSLDKTVARHINRKLNSIKSDFSRWNNILLPSEYLLSTCIYCHGWISEGQCFPWFPLQAIGIIIFIVRFQNVCGKVGDPWQN